MNPDLKPGPYVLLKVSDMGHGMDASTMERIFAPYFTDKNVGEGSGLGLLVVHGIVRRYKRAVRVHSEGHDPARTLQPQPVDA